MNVEKGQKWNVLSDGFIILRDWLGDDQAIVNAARISYGKGTRSVSDDEGLIRYLMRHHHATPFEMAEIVLHIRIPMDAHRQLVRHRTACLSGDTVLQVRDYRKRNYAIKDLFEIRRDKGNENELEGMNFRCLNEDQLISTYTQITDCWQTGVKIVYEVILEDYSSRKMSADHMCYTNEGWKKLNDIAKLPTIDQPEWSVKNKKFAVLSKNAEWLEAKHIFFRGQEMTYDIEVEGPYHNFSANGMIVHNSINEYSTRYSEAIDSRETTKPNEWRLQSTTNKQGSVEGKGGFLDESPGEYLSTREKDFHEKAKEIYEERLQFGVAKEVARKDLPLSTMTELIWKCDLRNILHFLSLRMDSHAQKEIRDYANIIGNEIVSVLFPLTWKAFQDYTLNAITLTALEIAVIKGEMTIDDIQNKREREEAQNKMSKIGLSK
jgi:thymidylate synthase ThyX